jgi:hypothetical protein
MRLPMILILGLVVAGCSTGPQEAPSSPSLATLTASPTSAVATASPTPQPSREATLVVCGFGDRCDAEPGTFVTDANGFFPGLQITTPAGWFFTEQDSGELALHPIDDPNKTVALYKDVRVITSTREMGPYNEIVKDVGPTAEAFVQWFTHNEAFTVVEAPTAATIAGTTGTVFTLAVSEAAKFGDPHCPSNPQCADLWTDPAHWGDNNFGIGGPTPVRLYVADVPYADGDHLFAIMWDGGPASELDAWVARTMPILDSILPPAVYVDN